MTASQNASLVLRRVRELALDDVSDDDLLERFTLRRDEHAFTALVRRYGRLVCSVCRAVLRSEQDTEDVFQATFLVLARKAASIRKREALASWLYAVAYRLAQKARNDAVRRRRLMSACPRPEPAGPLDELSWRELHAALHEELARLPGPYRSPVVLCCLEGHSRDEAAHRLGWPLSIVKSRLERGRELLRRRLAQRGLAPSAALAAALVTAGRGSAAPDCLIQSTTAGIPHAHSGHALSPRASLLAQKMLQGMLTAKLTIGIVFCGIVLALVAIGLYGSAPTEAMDTAHEANALEPVAEQNKDQPAAQEIPQFPPEPVRGEALMALKYSSDGQWMATAEMDGKVRLWSTNTQRPGPVLSGPKQMVRSVAFTPDGKTLVAGSDDRKIYVWDVRTGKLRTTLEGHNGWVSSVALASDGKTLASSSVSFEQGAPVRRELKIWDLARERLLRNIDCDDAISSGGPCGMAFAPGTELLAAACTGDVSGFKGVKVWNTTTGLEVKRFTYDEGFPLAIAISPDGKWLASGGGDAIPVAPNAGRLSGSLKVWDWGSGKLQQTLVQKSEGYFRVVAFSRDSTRLVAGSPGPEVARNSNNYLSSAVRCWETKQWGPLWIVQGLYGDVFALDISPDCQCVASSDSSRTAVIDAALGRVRGYWMTTQQKVDTEEFGEDRVTRRLDWADGMVNVANLDRRVYSRWVNGQESFFYRASAQAVNDALRKFAAVTGDDRQLVLLPGSGKTQTVAGKPISFDWQLDVPGGLTKAFSGRKQAVLTVFISALKPRPVERKQVEKWLGQLDSESFEVRAAASEELQNLGNDAKPLLRAALQAQPTVEMRRRIESLLNRLPSFDVADLEFPKGMVVNTASDLIAKGLEELKDADRNVRSLAIQDLSGLAFLSDEVVPALVEVFEKDKDAHIRQVAAACLGRLGHQAKPAVPILKQALEDPDANIRHTCGSALERIATAKDTPDQREQTRRDRAVAQEINEFKKATGIWKR
jgi:RNA polymerase sigma factor (sigma-70 family)